MFGVVQTCIGNVRLEITFCRAGMIVSSEWYLITRICGSCRLSEVLVVVSPSKLLCEVKKCFLVGP